MKLTYYLGAVFTFGLALWNVSLSLIRLVIVPQGHPEYECSRWDSSESWLADLRLGNSDVNMTGDFVKSMLLDYMMLPIEEVTPAAVFQHTLCHERSRFMTWSSDEARIHDEALQHWVLRLLYLVVHDHQHRPSTQEAHARFMCRQAQLDSSPLGKYDYECRDAKFLVLPLTMWGLGNNVHHMMVKAFLVGMQSNRVVVFVNGYDRYSNATTWDIPSLSKGLKNGWDLASCDRKDFQCFFLPTTPCVLTTSDIASAPVIVNETLYKQLQAGGLPSELDNARVLLLPMIRFAFLGKLEPSESAVIQKFATLANDLVERMKPRNQHSSSMQMLEKAATFFSSIQRFHIREPYADRPFIHWPISHAIVFYLLRPNLIWQDKIHSEMERNFPDDFDNQHSIGLPMRASDKCKDESECLSFGTYMDLADSIRVTRGWSKTSHPSIILTSESASIVASSMLYAANEAYPFSFVTNTRDTLQGTGLGTTFQKDADQVMLSTIVALKMQMLAKHTVGNCCSNFHNLLFAYLRNGCGDVDDAVSTCLQQEANPKFRVCCRWSETATCLEKWKKEKFNKRKWNVSQ